VDVDFILATLNRNRVAYLLIGGMNFMLRHRPLLTFDIDLWIEDLPENRAKCEAALAELEAEWGPADDDWKPVAQRPRGWLEQQALFCLTSPHGAIDIFRRVAGLDNWEDSSATAVEERTAAGTEYLGLSDEDMLKCQFALDEGLRKQDRIAVLAEAIRKETRQNGP
jgi:hypothetical protein